MIKLFEEFGQSWSIVDVSLFSSKTDIILMEEGKLCKDFITISEWNFLKNLILNIDIGKSYLKLYSNRSSFLYGYIENGRYINSQSNIPNNIIKINLYSQAGNCKMSITKSDDDYYFVYISNSILKEKTEWPLYFKCDQLYGVKDCIEYNCRLLQ